MTTNRTCRQSRLTQGYARSVFLPPAKQAKNRQYIKDASLFSKRSFFTIEYGCRLEVGFSSEIIFSALRDCILVMGFPTKPMKV